jgi:tRNA (guanine37-N1)-methyltransferase
VRIDVFSLFPDAFAWYQTQVHVRRARELGHELNVWNYRDHTPLSHLQVDDTPYGGGAGMVLRIDVVCAALEAVFAEPAEGLRERRRVVELTPRGRQHGHPRAANLVSDRVSIGPYVLSGGEVAAMALADAVLRKVDGVISNPDSVVSESHSPELGGGTEYPQYTRPAEFRGWTVPEVLLSGDHGAVDRWRREQVGGRFAPPPDAC